MCIRDRSVSVGTPIADGPALVTGSGISQNITVGTPTAARALDREFFGVGIDQPIDIGTPVSASYIPSIGIGINQTIDIGTPNSNVIVTDTGIGIDQTIDVGTPDISLASSAVGIGIEETISLGGPNIGTVASVFGAGIDQIVSVGMPDIVTTTAPVQTAVGMGIVEIVSLGTPDTITTSPAAQNAVGVGIIEIVSIGSPVLNGVYTNNGVGVEQDILINTPHVHHVGSALQLSQRQANTFPDIDTALQMAFGYGVQSSNPNLIAPIQDYINLLNPLQQQQLKGIFESVAAASITSLNIPGVLPTTNDNDSVSVAKVTNSGTSGLLNFIDGILVSKIDPT